MGVAEEENFKREKWSSWMDEREELIRQGILHETMFEVFWYGFIGLLLSIIGISWLFSLSWADDYFWLQSCASLFLLLVMGAPLIIRIPNAIRGVYLWKELLYKEEVLSKKYGKNPFEKT